MRVLVIDATSNVIVNVAIYDEMPAAADGLLYLASDQFGPGDLYDPKTKTVSAAPQPPSPVPDAISDRQFFQQLALDGVITQDEALAAVAVGTLPAALSNAVAAIPDQTARFNAKITIVGATTFLRSNPLTSMLGGILGKDDAALDALWRAAASL